MTNFYGQYVGFGAGGVIEVFIFGGTSYGYHLGGGEPAVNTVGKYSFTSDGNSSSVGTLTSARFEVAGVSSATHSYAGGGYGATGGVIDKMPFASDGGSSDVGDMSSDGDRAGCHSSTYGYGIGGKRFSPSPQGIVDKIDKFALASDGNASDIGNMSVARYILAANSSQTHGYGLGGSNAIPAFEPTWQNIIDKFPFASDANATDVGNLLFNGTWFSGSSSSTHGYLANSGQTTNVIQKHSFASDGDSSDIANSSDSRTLSGGNSSSTYGYTVAGWPVNVIDKYAFASDSDATDVGDASISLYAASGTFI